MAREDIMIDLETLGLKPGCVVLSIGAAKFSPTTGEVVSKFYERIAFKDSVLRGLTVDPDTYQWWTKQDKEVFAETMSGTKSLIDVCLDFQAWVREHSDVRDFWCQGTDFDFPIWEAAYSRGAPLANYFANYYQRRDTRTLYAVAGFDPSLLTREGSHHNALDDVLHQIRCVHESYRLLGLAEQQEEIDEL